MSTSANPTDEQRPLAISDQRMETFRRQLKAALKAGGVFYADEITANIEGLITAHIMYLVEHGANIEVVQENAGG